MRFPIFVLLASSAFAGDIVPDHDNLTVEESSTVKKGDYTVADADGNGVLRITSSDVVLDFDGATLSSGAKNPDERDGTGLRIENAKNVTIRHAIIRGYRFGISAKNCENLTLEDCDVSGSRAQHLHSRPDADKTGEDFLNLRDVNAWREYGAGIWLEGCTGATVKGCRGGKAQNGVLLVDSKSCRVLENDFSFNSGWGIGLYGSSDNLVAYNRADFCLRASWWPTYGAGGDSAGMVVVAGSDRNWIVANSLTHGGDGFFLTNRKDIGDPDDGACNDNIVAYNDGSWTPANCFEATFSKRNVFVGNKAEFGGWGFWLGFSSNNVLVGNDISDIRSSGIGIEHGSGNVLELNSILSCKASGIELWSIDEPGNRARAANPSKKYAVIKNQINGCAGAALKVSCTDGIVFDENSLMDNSTAILLGKGVKGFAGTGNFFQASVAKQENLAAGRKARFSLGMEVITDARATRTVDGVRSGAEAFEPHWEPGDFFEVDLGATAKFNLILLYTRSIDPYQFLFDYTVVASKTGAFKGEEVELLRVTNRLNERVQPIALPTTEARFIRLVSKTTQNWVGVTEFELYNAPEKSPLRSGLGGVEAWLRATDDADGVVDLRRNYWQDEEGRDFARMIRAAKVTVRTDDPLKNQGGAIIIPIHGMFVSFEAGLAGLRDGIEKDIRAVLDKQAGKVGCDAVIAADFPAPSKTFKMRRESAGPCGLDLMRADEWGPVEPKK